MRRRAATIRQRYFVVRCVFDLPLSTRFLFDPSAWSIDLRSIDATPFIPFFYLRRRRSFLTHAASGILLVELCFGRKEGSFH